MPFRTLEEFVHSDHIPLIAEGSVKRILFKVTRAALLMGFLA